jgi:chromosome segregation ATPase
VALHLNYDEPNTQREEKKLSLTQKESTNVEDASKQLRYTSSSSSISYEPESTSANLAKRYRKTRRYSKMNLKIAHELDSLNTHRHAFSDPLSAHQMRYSNYVPNDLSLQADLHRIVSKTKPSDRNLHAYSQSDSFTEQQKTSTPGMNSMLNQSEESELTTMLGNMSSHAKQLTSNLTDATHELCKAHGEIQHLQKRQTLLSRDLMSNTSKCTQQSSEIRKQALALDNQTSETSLMKQAMIKQRQAFSEQVRKLKTKLHNLEKNLKDSNTQNLNREDDLIRQREESIERLLNELKVQGKRASAMEDLLNDQMEHSEIERKELAEKMSQLESELQLCRTPLEPVSDYSGDELDIPSKQLASIIDRVTREAHSEFRGEIEIDKSAIKIFDCKPIDDHYDQN